LISFQKSFDLLDRFFTLFTRIVPVKWMMTRVVPPNVQLGQGEVILQSDRQGAKTLVTNIVSMKVQINQVIIVLESLGKTLGTLGTNGVVAHNKCVQRGISVQG
jgi:hypothetical protein